MKSIGIVEWIYGMKDVSIVISLNSRSERETMRDSRLSSDRFWFLQANVSKAQFNGLLDVGCRTRDRA